MKVRSCHSSAENLLAFHNPLHSHRSLTTACKFSHELSVPCWTSDPIGLHLHIAPMPASSLPPCTIPPQSLFSSCFLPQVVPGPPPIAFLTQTPPCQWGFHDHPSKSPHPLRLTSLLSGSVFVMNSEHTIMFQFIWLKFLFLGVSLPRI